MPENVFRLAYRHVDSIGLISARGALIFGNDAIFGGGIQPMMYNRWTDEATTVGARGQKLIDVDGDGGIVLLADGAFSNALVNAELIDRANERHFALDVGAVVPGARLVQAILSADGSHVVLCIVNSEYRRDIYIAAVDFAAGGLSAQSLVRVSTDEETVLSGSSLSISDDGAHIGYSSFVERRFIDGEGNPYLQDVQIATRVGSDGGDRRTIDMNGPAGAIRAIGDAGRVTIRDLYDHNAHYLRTVFTDGAVSHVLHEGVDGREPTRTWFIASDGRHILRVNGGGLDDAPTVIEVTEVASGQRRDVVVAGIPSTITGNALFGLDVSADGADIVFGTARSLVGDDTDETPDWYVVANPFNPHPIAYPSSDADHLTGTSESERWFLQGGADTAFMGGAADYVGGGGGDDLIAGEGGDDQLAGGSGNDTLYGGDDDDTLFGDQVSGDYPDDGNDTLSGGAGEDTIYGGGGIDQIAGDAGEDLIFGGAGDDTIDGGAHDDELYGEGGDDTINGGDGFDGVRGGDGDDQLTGGDGDDTLYGDAGADRFVMDAGNDLIWGGSEPEGKPEVRDTLILSGSASEYFIYDFATPTDRQSYAVIDGEATGRDLIHDVELIEFDALRTNVAQVDNRYVTMARAADVAYSNVLTMPDGWATVSAMELGLSMTGDIEGIDTRYVYANGIYRAVTDRLGGELEAAAHLYFGVVDGKNTLMLAFRGTDTIETDGQDYPEMGLHYARFAPLVTALVDYVATGGHTATGVIDQVLVTGHSLGGAMVQLFMQDERIYGDPRYTAATFGSPFAEQHRPDPRILHFEHTADPVPLAADAAQSLSWSSYPGLKARFQHWLDNQPNVLDYEPAGGVVRILADDSVGLGLPQHSMTNYVASVARMAAHPDLYRFMESGTNGLPMAGYTHVAVGSDGADTLTGGDTTLINLLRGPGYFGGNELFVPGAGRDILTGNGGQDVFRGTAAELNGDAIRDFGEGDRIRIEGTFHNADLRYRQEGPAAGTLWIGTTAINLGGSHDGRFRVIGSAEGYTDIGYRGRWSWGGSADADNMAGSDGSDRLSGGDGNDRLIGGAGNDELLGGIREVTLLVPTTTDDDLLDGGLGADRMTGGAGADIFTIGTDAVDLVLDFTAAEGDRLDISALMQAINWTESDVNPFAGGYLSLVQRDTATILRYDVDGTAGSGVPVPVARLEGVQLHTLDANDFYAGNFTLSPERVRPARFASDDEPTLRGSNRHDTLVGDVSDNFLLGLDGNDELVGRAGNDRLIGGKGDDRLIGGEGDDLLNGGFGTDWLFGGAGMNQLRGGDGDDMLVAGPDAADDWWGGKGNDRFVIGPEASAITIHDFKAGDLLDLSAFAFNDVSEVLDRFHDDGAGNVQLSLDEGTFVRLLGVTADAIQANDVAIFSAAAPADPATYLLPFLL